MAEEVKKPDQSYWAIVKRQFKKNRFAVWSLRMVYVIIVIGLLADFIANEKPLYCKIDGQTFFPVLKDYGVALGLTRWPAEFAFADWKTLELESAIWPPIPYSSTEMDIMNSQFVGPFEEQRVKSWRWKHLMGTDEIGRDVLAGMIHGTRIAMLVGIVSMSIATFIGIILGALAGYFGDQRLKISLGRLLLNFAFLFFAFFYSFVVRGHVLTAAFEEGMLGFVGQFLISAFFFILIMGVANVLVTPIKKVPALGKRISFPMDILVSRLVEIFISIPRLLLILAIVAIAKPSIMLVMVVIGATSWTGITRFIRGELLRVRSLEYIEAAQALGYSELRIVFRHAIPNALTAVLIDVAFGVAGAILIESSLSFLGIGLQPEVITWGKLLSIARQDVSAWWLAIFPGLAIFITVTVFNLLGEGLTDALDPRLKS